MTKKTRLTESDLHRIVKESVKRILKERYMDDDPPEDEAWMAEYDHKREIEDCEYDCSLEYWIDPSTKQIFKDSESVDYNACISFLIIPKFSVRIEDDFYFNLDNIDYTFFYLNKKKDHVYYEKFGDAIEQFINKNYDKLEDEIRKMAGLHYYAIY